MKARIVRSALTIATVLAPLGALAGGQVIEQVETYSINGESARALYDSIGERGPMLGNSRVIAQTGFKLTWRRDYQNRHGGCVLASAVPRLVIITKLPKPSARLPADVAARWAVFIEGVTAHEKVHAENIKVLAREIEKATIGLSAENDPDCNRLRAKMQPILKEISDQRRQKDRDFDKVEFGPGGTVQQLVIGLLGPG